MTLEEFTKTPFDIECHINIEGEHCTNYSSEDGRIKICNHVPYKNGEPKGKLAYRRFMLDGKVYKSFDDFVEGLKDFKKDMEDN